MDMPDFLLIGVAKSGTTSVHHYLKQHPQIAMCRIKEPNFFAMGEHEQEPRCSPGDRPWRAKTLAEYQALFAELPAAKLRGESSPSSFEERARIRIKHYLPDARFICILRQPVEREYSEFAHRQRLGMEMSRDFLRDYLARNQSPAGWYLYRLRDWLQHFQKQQIHICLFEDLLADPARFMAEIYAFLEVDDSFRPDQFKNFNRGLAVRSMLFNKAFVDFLTRTRNIRFLMPKPARRAIKKFVMKKNHTRLPPLDPAIRVELTKPQREDILRLQDLIGRDLSRWLAD